MHKIQNLVFMQGVVFFFLLMLTHFLSINALKKTFIQKKLFLNINYNVPNEKR